MIDTARLIIRPWRDDDRAPFAAMGRDPAVMRFLGPLASTAESNAAVDRMMAMQAADGHCFWAVERRADGAFIGFCGLKKGPVDTPLAGGIEIGWRLARDHWRQGYAQEAAQACLDWGWARLAVERIGAITVADNQPSRRLMERLGMVHAVADDFAHPAVPPDSPLRPHVTYWASRPGR